MSVRLIRITEVECDDCGYLVSFTDTKADAVRTLRDEGWTIGKKVLCPDCLKKASQEVSE